MAGTPIAGEQKKGIRILSIGLNKSGEIHAEGMLPADFHSVVSRAHDQAGASGGELPLDRNQPVG